jgi:hypothetical protein
MRLLLNATCAYYLSFALPTLRANHSTMTYALRTMLSSLGVGVRAQMAEAVATIAVRTPIIPSLFSLK